MDLESIFHLVVIVSVVVITGVFVVIGYQAWQVLQMVKRIGYEAEQWAANFSKMQYLAKAGVWGSVFSFLQSIRGGGDRK